MNWNEDKKHRERMKNIYWIYVVATIKWNKIKKNEPGEKKIV